MDGDIESVKLEIMKLISEKSIFLEENEKLKSFKIFYDNLENENKEMKTNILNTLNDLKIQDCLVPNVSHQSILPKSTKSTDDSGAIMSDKGNWEDDKKMRLR